MSTAPHESTCRTCGAVLEPGAVFCAECGARVDAPQPVVPSPYSVPTPAVRPVPPVGLAPPPPPGPPPVAVAPPPRRPASVPASREQYPVAPGAVASIGSRALAFAIDGVVLLVAYGLGFGVVAATGGLSTTTTAAVRPVLFVPALLVLLVGVAQWVAESLTGATVGNAVTGIRTVSNRTGRPAGLVAILVRQLVVALGALVCLVGEWVVVVSGTWDKTPAQRGWHDKAAGTLVLRARNVPRAPSKVPDAAWNTAVARTMGDRPAADPGLVPAPPVEGAPQPTDPFVPAGAAQPPTPPAPASSAVGPPNPLVPAPPAAAGAGTPDPLVRPAPGAEPQTDEFLVPLVPVRRVPDPPATRREARRAESAATADVITGMPGAAEGAAAPAARTQPVIDVPPTRPDSAPVPRVAAAPTDLGELEHTRLRPSGPPPAPAALRLSFDTGERVDVAGDGLVGRSPSAEDGVTHVVPVDDPARSISKTHLAFGLDGATDRLWVMDRGSTNGTVLVAPDGTSSALPPGTRATVAAGWTIRFGQRSARVERR